jgi:uncharacterized protein (TIGR02246 family)
MHMTSVSPSSDEIRAHLGNASIADGLATLYFALLDRWNARDAAGLAALFTEQGELVGFDGSEINGREAIESHLAPIFASHPTPAYFAKIRHTRSLCADIALLRALAGMLPDGANDLNPALNAVHTVVATQREGKWLIELFQNTPAAWHGRPHDVEALTQELRVLLPTRGHS